MSNNVKFGGAQRAQVDSIKEVFVNWNNALLLKARVCKKRVVNVIILYANMRLCAFPVEKKFL